MLRTEPNARIHALATVAAVMAGVAFEIGKSEWLAVTLAMVAVWTTEALNTAFEALCDVVSPDEHPKVARAKDVAAGAVLVSAVGAALVAAIIFGPRLLAAL